MYVCENCGTRFSEPDFDEYWEYHRGVPQPEHICVGHCPICGQEEYHEHSKWEDEDDQENLD